MTIETVVFGLGLAFVMLLAWRETRVRRVSALKKKLQGYEKRLIATERALSESPGGEVLNELFDRLDALERKLGETPQVKLEALVARVNDVSNDCSALKNEYVGIKNEVTRLKTGAAWSRTATAGGG
ncbi:MAG: hypothetical protein SFW67_28405 [Myxococcaceae bacterium]|nr:hypothetical protein [Myxococcaceae bacterium]